MANRRQLKKTIKCITGELLTDCIVLNLCSKDSDEKYEKLMAEVMAVHVDYVSRLSHVEKGSERLFFKKLREEFTERVNGLNERIISA